MKRIYCWLLCVAFFLTVAMPASAETTPTGEYGVDYLLYGDITLNQSVNAEDALKALQYGVGKTQLTSLQQEVADVNDSQTVDASDALDILRFAVGKLESFVTGKTYVPGNYLMQYDKTNSVNGAYVQDPTADCSFAVDLSTLPDYTLFRMSNTVFDGDNDRARLIYSLQGLVNREFGMDEEHSSLIYVLNETADAAWLDEISEETSILAQGEDKLTHQRMSDWDSFYSTFRQVIHSCGIVLWDGNVPATANVAATVCGVDGYLPVLANSPLHQQLVADGVPVKLNLVGMFEDGMKGEKIIGTAVDSTGSAKNDAYLWALEKYFPRCSANYLAYVLDGSIMLKGYDAYEDHFVALGGGSTNLPNHDYFIARRCFFFDLAVNAGEAACDDPSQQNGWSDKGTDVTTLRKILQARYDRANGAFGQLIGFVPWWAKYTDHNNLGSLAPAWAEWLFSEIITCYNVAKDADVAATANSSVYYKYVPKYSQYENTPAPEPISFDANTHYYTLYMGDYDSAAWMKTYVHAMWMNRGGDRYRGKIPLMWCYNPNLSYRIPMVFDYVYENKTDMDFFACGNSGAGYIMPSALIEGYEMPLIGQARPEENGDGLLAWAQHCETFYKRFDLDITGFIINSSVGHISADVADCFNRFSPVGNLSNCGDTLLGLYEGTPYVYCQNGVNATTDSSVLYNHMMNRMSGYNFAAYRTVLATPTEINTIVTSFETYAAGKGTNIQYCDPYTFFDLIRQSGQGTDIE